MLLSLMLLILPAIAPAQNQTLADDFFAAVRTGDAKAVEELLAKGVDVNTKFRYDQTALFPACDKGHTEVVRVLLAHGAKVDIKDTFYGASPLTWAVNKGHAEVVKLLLEKGAPDKANALLGGVRGNHPEVVKVVLAMGGVPDSALSSGLKQAVKDKHDDIVEMLKKAGAVMPPLPDFKVDEDTLKTYAGEYKSETGPPLTFKFKDGKVTGGVDGQPALTLAAFSKTKFTTVEFDAVTFEFSVEDGKVTGLTLVQGGFNAKYKKSEGK